VHDKVGIVAEIPECFCQKAEVAVPEKLVRADGEVGVEKDFHKTNYEIPRRVKVFSNQIRMGEVILQEGRFKVKERYSDAIMKRKE
jgi:hypothetical protein